MVSRQTLAYTSMDHFRYHICRKCIFDPPNCCLLQFATIEIGFNEMRVLVASFCQAHAFFDHEVKRHFDAFSLASVPGYKSTTVWVASCEQLQLLQLRDNHSTSVWAKAYKAKTSYQTIDVVFIFLKVSGRLPTVSELGVSSLSTAMAR